jgi:hypothetical protein
MKGPTYHLHKKKIFILLYLLKNDWNCTKTIVLHVLHGRTVRGGHGPEPIAPNPSTLCGRAP